MTNDATLSPDGLDALQKRFQDHSRTAQAYYTIMHAVREIAGNDDAANAWMNTGSPAFAGKTPAELVKEGREEEVLAHISALKT